MSVEPGRPLITVGHTTRNGQPAVSAVVHDTDASAVDIVCALANVIGIVYQGLDNTARLNGGEVDFERFMWHVKESVRYAANVRLAGGAELIKKEDM